MASPPALFGAIKEIRARRISKQKHDKVDEGRLLTRGSVDKIGVFAGAGLSRGRVQRIFDVVPWNRIAHLAEVAELLIGLNPARAV